MPFTLSHAAAAFPFRRTRLVFSALIVGTFAPDLEYFVRLKPGGGWGHKPLGAIFLSLPLALMVLWLFHRWVKAPAAKLLPESFERRATPWLAPFRFGPPRRFALIVFSILVGTATHILWDDFTHGRSWISHHWEFLQRGARFPVLGWVHYYQLLQYVSTLGGMAVLVIWFVAWFWTTPPQRGALHRPFSAVQKVVLIAAMLAVAASAAIVRAFHAVGVPENISDTDWFLGDGVVTFGALLWWQLVAFGMVYGRRLASRPMAGTGQEQSPDRGQSGILTERGL